MRKQSRQLIEEKGVTENVNIPRLGSWRYER